MDHRDPKETGRYSVSFLYPSAIQESISASTLSEYLTALPSLFFPPSTAQSALTAAISIDRLDFTVRFIEPGDYLIQIDNCTLVQPGTKITEVKTVCGVRTETFTITA